jgi:DNA-binding NarL/FixJ family response regulator
MVTGGEALDYIGSDPFHIALVKDALPDLPGTIVSKNIQSQNSDGIVLIFAHPGTKPGFIRLVEKHGYRDIISQLEKPEQLVEAISQLREAYIAKKCEKMHLQLFRQEHLDFIKQYVDLRKQLEALLPEGKR